MCLASIELARRGFEFYSQYIIKTKVPTKNIVFESFEKVKEEVSKSLEEFGITEIFSDIINVWENLKKRKCNIRVPLEKAKQCQFKRFFSKFSIKSYCEVYSFI